MNHKRRGPAKKLPLAFSHALTRTASPPGTGEVQVPDHRLPGRLPTGRWPPSSGARVLEPRSPPRRYLSTVGKYYARFATSFDTSGIGVDLTSFMCLFQSFGHDPRQSPSY
jgi:hypothetical protein